MPNFAEVLYLWARFLDLTVGRISEQACRAFGGIAL